MTIAEDDLKTQLGELDWGTQEPETTVAANTVAISDARSAPAPGDGDLSSLDVAVPDVPARAPRKRAQPRVKVARPARRVPDEARQRAARDSAPTVLTAAGESPAVISLFETMWKDQGIRLARSIGRNKVSKADAAIGWYTLLLAMRQRDATAAPKRRGRKG